MDARSAVRGGVAILVIVLGTSFSVYADPVYIYASDFNLPLLDPIKPGTSAMTEAIMEVPDYFTIDDLDVGISLTHSNVFDLQIFLQSPSGTTLCLNEYSIYEYFEGANYTQTIFDDEAKVPIEQGQPPFTGQFRPIEPYKLSVFDGEDTYGLWRLQIYDMWPVDTGVFNHFEIIITTPEPATIALLTFGIGLLALSKPNRRL